MNRFAFTCGDINGIGPEISIKTLNKIYNPRKRIIYFICPKNVFQKLITKIPFDLPYKFLKNDEVGKPSCLNIIDIGMFKQNIGKPTKDSGKASLLAIRKSLKLYDKNIIDAIITAPISKYSFELAGIKFPGHTELLGKHFKHYNYSMMFLSNKFKVALITIHIPIKVIPKRITKINVQRTINVVIKSLKYDFNIQKPKIAILGLNPHAGEKGKIGKEEIEVLHPIIKPLKNVFGPFVPDAFFGMKKYKNFDVVIGMYHDQVLIPFKLLNFERGVNFTAGLPVVRTSPDHGTAFDIANKYSASEISMLESFKWANRIVNNRNLYR